jgi:hypothetical protein
MWKIGAVKSEGRRILKTNYLVCFVACLVLVLVVNGPMSISETAEVNKLVIKQVADNMPGTPVARALNKLLDGADAFKKSTSLGSDATRGKIGDAYQKIAAADGLEGLMANALSKYLAEGRLDNYFLSILRMILSALLYIFIGGVIEVGLARIFLETRNLPDTRISKLFFIFRIGGTGRVARIIFLRSLYLILWTFTIVGLPIKYYSYRLVPYIVAENPYANHREVFALSSRLMRGHKMKMFLFDLSFIPLRLLSIFTFGIVSYVWLNPYYNASKAEIYASIRGDELALREYSYIRLPGKIEGVLSLAGARPKYSLINITLMFLLFSFIGWVFECSLFLIEDGVVINRGTMYGPWIPIYGVGGIVIITIVNRFYKKPLVCFFMIIAVCAPIEYIGAWLLWQTRHLKYWDYSDYFLNLQGRICLESMLNFAIMGTVGIYVIAPVFDSLMNRIPTKTRKTMCVALYAAFFTDAACSNVWPRTGKGITDDLS